jgi:dihydrofolate reductase
MKVSAIVAYGKNQEIGHDNQLPWHIPDDLRLFKKTTEGHTLVMGRKTFDSIGKKALPGRKVIVLSRQPITNLPINCYQASGLKEALSLCRSLGDSSPFICGGAEIYQQALENNLIDRLYISEVDYQGQADTFFPKIDLSQWRVLEECDFNRTAGQPLDWKRKILEKIQ